MRVGHTTFHLKYNSFILTTSMKRRLFLFLFLIVSLSELSAQSYNSLWKLAEQAMNNDLPQTALDVVKRLEQKAQKDRNTSWLIRASYARLTLERDISTDSIAPGVARIRSYRDNETRPAERALWNLTLGNSLSDFSWQDTSYQRQAMESYESMFVDLNALATARTKNYKPILEEQKNSKYFNNDLLHVLAFEFLKNTKIDRSRKLSLLSRLIDYYGAQGNRSATFLWTLDSIERTSSISYDVEHSATYERLKSLIRQYQDLDLCVLAYIQMTEIAYNNAKNDSLLTIECQEGIRRYSKRPEVAELRNYLAEINAAKLSISDIPEVVYPNESYSARLIFKAKTNCELRIYRLDDYSALDGLTDVKWSTLPRTLVRTYSYQVQERPPYLYKDTTVRLVSPEQPGVYLLRLYDGDKEHDASIIACTRLKQVNLSMGNGITRIAIVDAMSGAPITSTRMKVKKSSQNRYTDVLPDSAGYYTFSDKTYTRYSAFVYTDDDQAMPVFSFTNNDRGGSSSYAVTQLRIFTDRGIYRPGQDVIVGGFLSKQLDDDIHAVPHTKIQVRLYDSNYKMVSQQETQTDEFGSFSANFTLPQSVLPGTFSLLAMSDSYQSRMSIEVQEYKRPTFTVTFDPVTETYAWGDTLTVTGVAKTYSGLPVDGARVHFETNRYEYLYWFRRGDESANMIAIGDTVTDSEGRFSIPVVLRGGEGSYYRHAFQTRVDVTSQNGETQSERQMAYVSSQKAYLNVDWPELVCFERSEGVQVQFANTQGYPIEATAVVHVMARDTEFLCDSVRTGETYTISREQLPMSGKYTIKTTVEYEGDVYERTSTVTFFSENDTSPVTDDVCWYNIRESAQGDTVYVIIGSPAKDVTMFYDIANNRDIVSSQLVHFSDSLLHFTVAWKPEYGDAAKVLFAFVKNGKLYSQTASVQKPQPDKRLQIGWQTFRSRLTPGASEVWKLRVTLPDGTPAKASMMARLYDASLDALSPYTWSYYQSFPRQSIYASWQTSSFGRLSLKGNYPVEHHNYPELSFTRIDPLVFDRLFVYPMRDYTVAYRTELVSEPVMVRSMAANTVVMREEMGDEDAGEGSESDGLQNEVDLRTNFSETAFFYPTLRTDSTGEVTIAFTLPESLTQWNFRAFAHTEDMRYAFADTSCVARKEFMVEPAMPRFVREGDKAQIPVTVRNLTTQPLAGTLLLQILEPATNKLIHKETVRFSTAKESNETYTFSIDAARFASYGLVTVRVTGSSGLYGDGEEHNLPILSAREQVVATLPFSLNNHTAQTLRIDTLWSKSSRMASQALTVEATSNPAWYAVTALPVVYESTCYSSTTWAERLYAVILARYIAQANPDIVKAYSDSTLSEWSSVLSRDAELSQTILEESPWLLQSESEQARAQALATLFDDAENALREHAALDQLRKLQKPDGSWSWCPGMTGNLYITSRIAVILARLQCLAGYQTDMLPRAMSYMEDELLKYVEKAKKKKLQGCPYEYLRYLYAASLADRNASNKAVRNAIDYLLEQIIAESASEDMHTKSLMAVVLSHYDKKEQAAIVIQSLIEHTTIGEPTRGRYFDTRRAPMSWSSYRIPTHTSTMEALMLTSPEVMWSADGKLVGVRDDIIAQMQLWLLQAKRTQMWETSSASVDAIYALLLSDAGKGSDELSRATTPLRYTLQDRRGRIVSVNSSDQVAGAETAGYIKDTYTTTPQVDAQSVTLRGYDNTISWGSIYASYTLPIEDVAAASQGLGVTRRLEVRQDGKWIAYTHGQTPLHVGDRLRMVFTLSADKDYDFVSLRTGRAACCEPVNRLSGYQWNEAGGSYRVVRDADIIFYFEKLAKGSYTFTEELLIDRAGVYSFAPARLQSVYAPEFQGITTSSTIQVEK